MRSTGEAIRFIDNLGSPIFKRIYSERNLYLNRRACSKYSFLGHLIYGHFVSCFPRAGRVHSTLLQERPSAKKEKKKRLGRHLRGL